MTDLQKTEQLIVPIKNLDANYNLIQEFDELLTIPTYNVQAVRSQILEHRKINAVDFDKAAILISLLTYVRGTNNLINKLSLKTNLDSSKRSKIRLALNTLGLVETPSNLAELTPLRFLTAFPEILSYCLKRDTKYVKDVGYDGPLPKHFQHTNAIHLLTKESDILEWKKWSDLHTRLINSNKSPNEIEKAIENTHRIIKLIETRPLFNNEEIIRVLTTYGLN